MATARSNINKQIWTISKFSLSGWLYRVVDNEVKIACPIPNEQTAEIVFAVMSINENFANNSCPAKNDTKNEINNGTDLCINPLNTVKLPDFINDIRPT